MGNMCREENDGEGQEALGGEKKKETEKEEKKQGRREWLRLVVKRRGEKDERRLEIEIDDIESAYDRDGFFFRCFFFCYESRSR